MSQTDRDVPRTTSMFSRRRRRQHSSSQDASSTCSSSPESRRLSDGHLFKTARSAAPETTTMRRSCAAAVLACSTRTKPPSDSERIAASDHTGDPRRCPRLTRRPTLSTHHRLSENKENIADDERCSYSKYPDSPSSCKSDIRYRRLFPDLDKVEEEEQSSLVRTSSVVRDHEDLQCQTTSTTMTLEDVSAISRTSDGEGGVLHRVRSTTSASSLNGAFCSSSGDAEDDAAGAFCSTFSYPLHSTVIDSFFDVSALLPPRPLPSPRTADDRVEDSRSASQERRLDGRHTDGSSRHHRSCESHGRKDNLHPRLFSDVDRSNVFDDVLSSCRLADSDRRHPSTTVERLSPSFTTTELDFARTGDANVTSRLRRQMGQTRLHTTHSSSSQRQSDFTCSRLNVDDDCSRSTLFECGCSAETRVPRLPPAAANVQPTSKNSSLSRSHRRCAEQFESPACFVDTCRSWSSDRRRMTLHCPPTTRSEALFVVDRPTDAAVHHDRHQMPADDQRQTGYHQLRSLPHRRTPDERLDRRQRIADVVGDRVGGGGCPLCGCDRPSDGEAAARRWSRTSKLTSSNNDDAAAERRRKRALLRKLRRFSDALYGNAGELQLKTFGHF